jgi:ribosomal protein S18 acetylase RimI-like enzyme
MKSKVTLRPAVSADYDFLYDLHRQTLKRAIQETWGWDEAWQRAHFQQHFDLTGKNIIQQNGRDIGCLKVLDEGDHIFLSYIAITPEFQNRGIGTRLIREVLAKGGRSGKPVTLKVLKNNPARVLYERLGFVITKSTDTHYLMEAEPSHGQN